MEFNNIPPKWDAQGAEPSKELQENGFLAGYKPPAAYFNYLFNKYTACLNELQAILDAIDDGTIQVGDSAKLGGKGAELYALLTDLANYLPLSGGWISDGVRNDPLSVKGLTGALINYRNSDDVRLGSIGVSSDGSPIFNGKGSQVTTILHTGNKPSGSYTGNGSATERTINIGGICYNLVITSDTGTAWVSSRGAICLDRTTGVISSLKSWECYLKDGVLHIAANSELVNKSSQAYWYDTF